MEGILVKSFPLEGNEMEGRLLDWELTLFSYSFISTIQLSPVNWREISKIRLKQRFRISNLEARPKNRQNEFISRTAHTGYGEGKGGHRGKKVTKLRTFSVPPLAPPPPSASTDFYGGLFSKSAYWRLATFSEKSAYVTIFGGKYPFH